MAEIPDLGERPIISLFGNTEKENFPLILVIGSGVNDDLPKNDEIGHYDLKKVPHSELRSAAYRLVARSKGTSVKFLMELCKLKESSILVFADISPATITNMARNKNQRGDKIRPEDCVGRVQRVMSTSLFDRAAMVMLPGLGHERYRKAVQAVETKSRAKGKMVARSLPLGESEEREWAGIKRSFSKRELDFAAAIFDRWMTNSTFRYLEGYAGHHNPSQDHERDVIRP